MPIEKIGNSSEQQYYYSKRFKTLVRSRKEFLVRTATEYPLTELHVVEMFKHDFYALLRHLQVDREFWWATAFINDILDPFASISGLKSVYMINPTELSSCITRSNTSRR